MAIPTKDQTNAAAVAAEEARITAGNERFIDDAEVIIARAASQGRFKASLYTNADVDLSEILDYFQGLGYSMSLPQCNSFGTQPAQLFGECWENFWNNHSCVCRCKEPCMVTLYWDL